MKNKKIKFKPIDIYDRIDDFCTTICALLALSGTISIIFIACYVGTRLWTGNEYNWAAIPMGISLLMTILFGIMAIINDNMWESKYSRIGKQIKAGIDYWERIQEIKKIMERE